MLGALFDAAKNYSRMEEYFELVLMAVSMSRSVARWFEVQDLGPRLVQFVCGDSPAIKLELPAYNYSNSKKTDAVNTIVKILHVMVN